MLRYVLTILVFVSACFCGDVSWMKLQDAKNIAKKDGKILMVEVSSHSCGYCIEMANTTFKNDAITAKINKYFAPVLLYADTDEIPKEFQTRGTPTFFFMDKNGKRLMPPIFGAWNVSDFDSFLEAAIKKAGVKTR